MIQSDVPQGYSAIQHGNVLGNTVQFTTKAEVEGKPVRATYDARGVQLKVDECNFRAIVEFKPHPLLTGSIHDPKRWRVGFVQNITQGGIVYRYGEQGQGGSLAMVGPAQIPCKDSGSPSSWYNPDPRLSMKQFGIDNRDFDMFPDDFPVLNPAREQPLVRYIEMGDAPGTGKLPIDIPCKQVDPGGRAVMNTNYTIGWTDPLAGAGGLPLTRIAGNLVFKTWLALSSEANPANVRSTTLFLYLYSWDWMVNYSTRIVGGIPQPESTATLILEGPCNPFDNSAIVINPDANASICVKFLP